MSAWALPFLAALPLYLALMARAAGGGLFASLVWSRLPEILFALPFGVVSWFILGDPVAGAASAILAFVGVELGHGTVYAMRGYEDASQSGRIQTLERFVRPVYLALGGDIYRPAYSWVVMGVKGTLIGCAALPFGLVLAVLWPAAYWIGRRIEPGINEVAEYLSGLCAGCALAATALILPRFF